MAMGQNRKKILWNDGPTTIGFITQTHSFSMEERFGRNSIYGKDERPKLMQNRHEKRNTSLTDTQEKYDSNSTQKIAKKISTMIDIQQKHQKRNNSHCVLAPNTLFFCNPFSSKQKIAQCHHPLALSLKINHKKDNEKKYIKIQQNIENRNLKINKEKEGFSSKDTNKKENSKSFFSENQSKWNEEKKNRIGSQYYCKYDVVIYKCDYQNQKKNKSKNDRILRIDQRRLKKQTKNQAEPNRILKFSENYILKQIKYL